MHKIATTHSSADTNLASLTTALMHLRTNAHLAQEMKAAPHEVSEEKNPGVLALPMQKIRIS